jgi:hypothetical protein
MMQVELKTPPVADKATAQAQAWRMSYLAAAPAGQAPLAVISEPRAVVAIASPIELANAMAAPAGPREDSLLVVWVPSAVGVPVDLDSSLQAWIRRDLAPNRAPVQASIKTVRVLCTETRSIIYAVPEHLSEAMDAVARFTLAARQTADLEAQVAATWRDIQAHTPLTHGVKSKDLGQQRQVNALTERVTEMKTMHLRLQIALEQLDQSLSSTSKRMYADLADAASLHDRMEMIEDPIQFALDHYELANSRLAEVGLARKGLILEAMIVVVLLADFVVHFSELLILSGRSLLPSGLPTIIP